MDDVSRIWTHVSFSDQWKNCDTSILDEIAPSWMERRKVLVDNSREYEEFMTRLKRKHAIETGVIERMYDLDKGVTETLIKEGFVASLINHGDTNIEKGKLLRHLEDHLEAVNFVFDVVKENRPLTKGFMLELHQLVTRNQDYAEGRDQFGNKTEIPLIKGRFKERENNPTRPDGVVVQYCPPDHVDSEVDELFSIYEQLIEDDIHPLIIASWFHHAFTTIHPFQDGNGRVVRLMASLILIKYNFFPITVIREEAKEKYIAALEKADFGEPQRLVTYFAEIQRRNIEEVLNLKEVSGSSLEEVTGIFKRKLEGQDTSYQESKERKLLHEKYLSSRREELFELCNKFLSDYRNKLQAEFGNSVDLYLGTNGFGTRNYVTLVEKYAQENNYVFNRHLPKGDFRFSIGLNDGRRYDLIITIHHYGYDDATLAIGGFILFQDDDLQAQPQNVISINTKPHITSIATGSSFSKKNIEQYLENLLVVTIAQIASEL